MCWCAQPANTVVKKRKVSGLVAVICFESAKCVFSKYREYGAFLQIFA
jgi:hypothetical protein